MFILMPSLIFLFGALFGVLLALTLLSILPITTNAISFLFTFAFAYVGGLLSLLWEDIFYVFG